MASYIKSREKYIIYNILILLNKITLYNYSNTLRYIAFYIVKTGVERLKLITLMAILIVYFKALLIFPKKSCKYAGWEFLQLLRGQVQTQSKRQKHWADTQYGLFRINFKFCNIYFGYVLCLIPQTTDWRSVYGIFKAYFTCFYHELIFPKNFSHGAALFGSAFHF